MILGGVALKEEPPKKEYWEKSTIEYAIGARSGILRMIKAYGRGRITPSEAEDVFSNLLEYLYKSEDYSLERASVNEGNIMDVGAYVKNCLYLCIKRYMTNKYNNRVDLRDDLTGEEDASKERDFTEVDYSDLDRHLRALRCKRYKYGDMYLVLYITCLCDGENRDKIDRALKALGIKVEPSAVKDEEFMQAISSVSFALEKNRERTINLLEGHIYGADSIKDAILNI